MQFYHFIFTYFLFKKKIDELYYSQNSRNFENLAEPLSSDEEKYDSFTQILKSERDDYDESKESEEDKSKDFDARAQSCKKINQKQNEILKKVDYGFDVQKAFIFWACGGILGMHFFYLRKNGWGILYLCTV